MFARKKNAGGTLYHVPRVLGMGTADLAVKNDHFLVIARLAGITPLYMYMYMHWPISDWKSIVRMLRNVRIIFATCS